MLASSLPRLVALSAACLLGVCQATAGAGQIGKVLEGRTFQSDALGREWAYSIYLPPDYDTSEREYPVVYMLHGIGGDHTRWFRDGDAAAIADSLIAAALIPPVILVSADGSQSFWVDSDPVGAFGPIETAFVEDLVPHVDRTYRTMETRRGRMVLGNSMGGYGALHVAFKHPEMFRAVAALSPAIRADSVYPVPGPAFGEPFDPSRYAAENPFTLLESFRTRGGDLALPVYLVAGDADFRAWLMEGTMDFHLALYEADLPTELRIVDGRHDWALWRSTLGSSLVFVTGRSQGTAR